MGKDEAKPRAFPWAANTPGPPERSEGNPAGILQQNWIMRPFRWLFLYLKIRMKNTA